MKYVIVCAFFLFSSCKKDAEKKVASTNNEFDVELLFEVDGCKVYRFLDGNYRYFTNCKGSVEWTESCGKNCRRQQTIQTN